MKLRRILWACAALVVIPAVALAFQSQRAQIGITIIINATPNPLGFRSGPGASDGAGYVIARLRGAPRPLERAFEAQQLHLSPVGGTLVAQSVQHDVKVEAEVTPNPNATLLTSDAPGYTVTLNAEAGIATVFPCAYHVKVQTTVPNWQLKHGLSQDFSDGTGDSFVGGSVANNTHVGATPLPTATPFVVYATDGSTWAGLTTQAGTQQYCVDLTVNMPIATPQGTYSSNAIYTLFY